MCGVSYIVPLSLPILTGLKFIVICFVANPCACRNQRLRMLRSPETGDHVHGSLGSDRPAMTTATIRWLSESRSERNVGGGRRRNLRCNFETRGPSCSTTAGSRRTTGGDPDLATVDISPRPGDGAPPTLAALDGTVGRDPAAGNDDGIPVVGLPDRPCVLAAVVGACPRTGGGSGRTAATNHIEDDPRLRRTAFDVNPVLPVRRQKVAAGRGRRNEVGSAEVVINVQGQVLPTVRRAANVDRPDADRSKTATSLNPRNRTR